MEFFTYRKARVIIPRQADITPAMLPNGEFAGLVQEMIEETPPWRKGQTIIEECHFPDYDIRPMVVKLPEDVEPVWGIHKGHTARHPRLSPFIDGEPASISVGWITIQLSAVGYSAISSARASLWWTVHTRPAVDVKHQP